MGGLARITVLWPSSRCRLLMFFARERFFGRRTFHHVNQAEKNMRERNVALLVAILLSFTRVAAAQAAPPHGAGMAKPGAVFNVLDYGASAAAADNTAAVQAAIHACQKTGGGIVEIPTGTFRFSGTLTMTSNHVWLRGVGRSATTLFFDNGGADCIVVGNHIPPKPPIAAEQRTSNKITDLNIVHGRKTAGRTVAVINHADFILEKVTIDHCVVGVYAERINNVVLRDIIIIPDNKGALDKAGTRWSSWVGVWWDTPPNPDDPSARSDVLYFDNVCINCNSAPGTGVLWDGMTNTFLINYANILNGAYGFRVINSRHNKQYLVPQFLNAFALLIENAGIDMSIETGCEFKITSSGHGYVQGKYGADTPGSFRIADGLRADHELPHRKLPKDGHRGQCQGRQDLPIRRCSARRWPARSKYPVIEAGPNAIDVSISDIRAEEHIGARLASYAVSLAAGATNIQIDNLNANYVNRAAVENKGAAKLMIGKLIEPGSANPAGVYDDGAASGYFAKDYPGQTRFVSKNWATGAVGASIGASTGSRQAYLEIAMNDNSGRPFASYRYGNAVTTAYEKIPERVFKARRAQNG